jgi:glycosyltransferase involved in cell wall biosynthesis
MKSFQNTKWFILAHCFNMDGRAASHTITDRIPLLLAQNIKPVVLSAPTGKKDRRFPHYQTFSPAPSGFRFEMRHVLKNHSKSSIARKILKAILTLAILPLYAAEKIAIQLDSHWSWFITASVYGIFIITKHRPEIIYSTAGPSSTHYAGCILSKIFGLPWVAEIHDPLIYDHEKQKWHKYFYQKNLEKLIFKRSSIVIYFTEKARKNAERRNPGYEHKTMVIRPGALPPKIKKAEYKKREKIHFGHFGSLSPRRNLEILFEAFNKLFQKRPDLSKKIVVDIYGTKLDHVSERALKRYPVQNILERHGRLEYDPVTGKSGREQILEAMQKTDVLLLLHGTDINICHEHIPSKVYDYMLVNRPILGLTYPDSELYHMLEENGFEAANIKLSDGVQEKISHLIERWEKNGLPDIAPVKPHTVEEAVERLTRSVEKL